MISNYYHLLCFEVQVDFQMKKENYDWNKLILYHDALLFANMQQRNLHT